MTVGRRALTGLAVAATVACAASAAGAATILNGNFETSALTHPQTTVMGILGFVTLGAGNTELTGWTIGGGGVDFMGSYWTPAAGAHSLDLSAFSNGILSQTISTVVGQSYDVSFDLAGNTSGPPIIKHLKVDVGGSPDQIYTFNTTGFSRSHMGWQVENYVFTAVSTLSTLSFSSIDPPSGRPLTGTPWGPALDNVSIATAAAVPEPATWALMITGMGLVGAGLRRRAGARLAGCQT
jgi:choice-of-anchor C domain-containing protein